MFIIKAEVAIILLNWNNFKDTKDCLISLNKLEGRFKVFLVDNCSSDGSYERLKEFINDNNLIYPISIYQAKENNGFASGNNIAIKQAYQAGYEYFWLLNNDTIVDKMALNYLLTAIKKNSVGVVGSKIYYYDSKIIWFAGGKVNRYNGNVEHIGYLENDSGLYKDQIKVGYITGCSLMTKREVIDSIGLMREDYFLYFEETDWNLRIRSRGWDALLEPRSVVYHKVSRSSGGESNKAPYVAYYFLRNKYVMVIRNEGYKAFVPAILNMYLGFFKECLKVLIRNQDQKKLRIKYLIRGIKDGLTFKMGKL